MSRPAPAMQSNHLHDLHAAAGANLRPAAEAAPLLSYGDVPGEYAAACRDWVVFDETDRGLLRLSGEDAAEFLHRLLANLVLPLEAGHGNRNLLLTAKGKVRFDFRLKHETEGDYLIDCSPHEASAILAALPSRPGCFRKRGEGPRPRSALGSVGKLARRFFRGSSHRHPRGALWSGSSGPRCWPAGCG